MLYLYHGADTQHARVKARTLIAALLKKKPDAALFRLDDETFSEAAFEEYMGGQGLFSEKYIVFLDKTFSNDKAKEEILMRLKEMEASENIVIILEELLDKKTLTKLEKHAEKSVACNATEHTKPKKREDFNVFALTDALGEKNKKQLWVLYQKAIRAGKSPEEIHGVLWWQLKTMLSVVVSQDERALKLKPFVMNKAHKFTRNYSEKELKQLSSDFLKLYHEARRGIVGFDVGLEKILLCI